MTNYTIETHVYNIDVTMPHLYHREVTERNGNDIVTYVWHIDESKPRIWLDGYNYRFNSTLIDIIRVPSNPR